MTNPPEKLVKNEYEKKGYTVLSVNDPGFPDLIAIKDEKIALFIEVKSWENTEKSLRLNQIWYHQYLERLGFEVKNINVDLDEKKLTEFQPNSNIIEISKLREDQNPYK